MSKSLHDIMSLNSGCCNCSGKSLHNIDFPQINSQYDSISSQSSLNNIYTNFVYTDYIDMGYYLSGTISSSIDLDVSNDNNEIIIMNPPINTTLILTLPSPILNNGRKYYIKNNNINYNYDSIVTINYTPANFILSLGSLNNTYYNDVITNVTKLFGNITDINLIRYTYNETLISVIIVSDGSQWHIISSNKNINTITTNLTF